LLWPILEALGVTEPRRFIMFGWLALALGDGLAGLVGPGPTIGRTVPWNRQKTWWGVAGSIVGSLIAFLVAFTLPFPAGALPAWQLWVGGVICAAAVAAAESAELPADDNYVVGLGAAVSALLVVALLGRVG
jgi:dolichol kinase